MKHSQKNKNQKLTKLAKREILNVKRECTEIFREDFTKIIRFKNGDYLIGFPDGTKIQFEKAKHEYLGNQLVKDFNLFFYLTFLFL